MKLKFRYISIILLILLTILSFIYGVWLWRVNRSVHQETYPRIPIPEGFQFGAGTSALSIEAALEKNGKVDSYLDLFLSLINLENDEQQVLPEISNNSYRRHKEDVEIMKNIGLKFYRFPISWTRLLPTGYKYRIDEKGVQYYNNLLDELEQAGIEPIAQLNHFDHPAIFENLDGWQSEIMVELFKDYARVVFQKFGHRIKYFLTFNEPNVFCNFFDSLYFNRGDLKATFPRNYRCSNNILKAHAEVYHLYHDKYNPNGEGMISINLLCNNFVAKDKNDQKLVDIAYAFDCGWFAHPIFSKSGDYSDTMKKRIEESIELREIDKSYVPTFSDYWIERIRGTADFFSLSYQTAFVVETAPIEDPKSWPNVFIPPEARLILTHNETWTPTPYNNMVSQGLRRTLKIIKEKYYNTPVYIFAKAYADEGRLDDIDRMKCIYIHVIEAINAINYDQCNVRGYIYHTLTDEYEFWNDYDSRSGLVYVDFETPNRMRILRQSAEWLRDVIAQKHLFLDTNSDVIEF